MNKDQAAALRKAFPPGTVGKLPKGGVMLDYVGHAATTDRLLQVDPEWTWEPLAVDEAGLPAMDAAGNLWIRLTVAGVTRIGVGDGKNMKERIGDAIRNAAMRFGVALDLWAKEDLHAMEEERGEPANHDSDAAELIEQERAGNVAPKTRRMGLAVNQAQLSKMHACFNDLGITDRDERLQYTNRALMRDDANAVAVGSSKELTKAQAGALINALEADITAAVPSLAAPPDEAS